jgi:hypothetical protein
MFQPQLPPTVFSPALCLVISKYFDTLGVADCFVLQLHAVVATTRPLEQFVLFCSSCLTVDSHRGTICILECLDSFPPRHSNHFIRVPVVLAGAFYDVFFAGIQAFLCLDSAPAILRSLFLIQVTMSSKMVISLASSIWHVILRFLVNFHAILLAGIRAFLDIQADDTTTPASLHATAAVTTPLSGLTSSMSPPGPAFSPAATVRAHETNMQLKRPPLADPASPNYIP